MLFVMKQSNLYNLFFTYPKVYKEYDNLQLNPKNLERAIDVSFEKLKLYAYKCRDQYIDDCNDDEEEDDEQFTLQKYLDWVEEIKSENYVRTNEYDNCWWEDVFDSEIYIKKMLHALAGNPDWWLAFLETRLKQNDAANDPFNKRQNRKNNGANFSCFCPFNKLFDGWYEFTKTSPIVK